MTYYRCAFNFHGGILYIDMDTQGDKHGVDPIEEMCEAYAKAIGATFLYHSPREA